MEERICYHCFSPLKNREAPCPHCGYDAREREGKYPLALPEGSILNGRYIVGRTLGQGGFGITYVAQEVQTGQRVAIKEFFPETMATRSDRHSVMAFSGQRQENFTYGMKCFLTEAQTLAQFIGTENIVRVHSYFEENGTAYFVMDYVDGVSFQTYLKQRGGKISWEEAKKILFPVMDALSIVHSKGIIHRDIAPDNIYITSDGTVKLLDFGAARYSLGDKSRSLDVVLKAGFAPKEQYSRRGKQGPFTDVYAIAATMYCAITGRIPPESVDRTEIEEDELVMPSSYGVHIPRAAEDALEKALAVRSADRWQTMAEFRQALTDSEEKVIPILSVYPELKLPEKTIVEFHKDLTSDSYARGVAVIPEMIPDSKVKVVPGTQPAAVQHGQKRENQSDFVKYHTPGKKKNGLWAFAAVAAALLVVLLFGFNQKPQKSAQEIPDVSEQTVEPTQTSGQIVESGVMMSDSAPNEFDGTPYEADNDRADDLAYVLSSQYLRKDIITVQFLDSIEKAPEDAWDVSEVRDESVLAWVDNSDRLYIAANGGVRAPADCSRLFENYTNVVEINFDGAFHVTSDVTNMDSMFGNCSALTQLDVSGFDTSNVTEMDGMFAFCHSLKELDVHNFDTSKVTDMDSMFGKCSALEKLDISGFDTSSVTNMRCMFYQCSALKTLDVSGFDTSKVTDMEGMFYQCSALKTLDLSSFDTSSVTNMRCMFYQCSALKTLDVSSFDTSKVTDMDSMFGECSALEKLDISGFDTSSVTNMRCMFAYDSALKTLDVSSFDTSKVTDMDGMFGECSALEKLDISGFDTSSVTNMRCMFYQCSALKTLDLSSFDTSSVTNMRGMFAYDSALKTLDVSGFDTSDVTDMGGMFRECSSLTTLDVSGFDTSKVTSMSCMFTSCKALKEMDVSGFNTSNVMRMDYMFYECCILTILDVSGFDTSNVTNMEGMFNYCYAELKLGDWETGKVQDYDSFMESGRKYNRKPWENLFK